MRNRQNLKSVVCTCLLRTFTCQKYVNLFFFSIYFIEVLFEIYFCEDLINTFWHSLGIVFWLLICKIWHSKPHWNICFRAAACAIYPLQKYANQKILLQILLSNLRNRKLENYFNVMSKKLENAKFINPKLFNKLIKRLFFNNTLQMLVLSDW